MFKGRILALAIALAASGGGAIAACSSSSTSSGGGGGTITVRVKAAEGGKVTDPSGKATLSIPPGALATDTDITLAVQPKSGEAQSEILEFGPNGTKFLKPATLEIKADGITVPQGKRLSLAINEGGKWTAINGSGLNGNVVSGSVEHFTGFTIILVDGQAVLVAPSDCTDAFNKFKACSGGNIQGTWKFDFFCAGGGSVGQDPTGGRCPGASASVDLQMNRDVVIDATTIKVLDGTETTTYKYTIPLTCLGGAGGACAQLGSQFFKPPATGSCIEQGSDCVCNGSQTEQKTGDVPDTYTTSGTTLTITSGETGGVTQGEYCTDGTRLYSKFSVGDAGASVLWVLSKK
jgi:hypothetical protein